MVDVSRSRQPNHGMDEEGASDLVSGALGQLLVNPVQRITRLEGHDVDIAHAVEHGANAGRGRAKVDEVIVPW
jgi:hypothetical protein